jgi:Eisosome protein 1
LEEANTIARARLQPTLDDITEKAEKQRARDEEIRLDQERQQREAENERIRQAELKQDIKNAQGKSTIPSGFWSANNVCS